MPSSTGCPEIASVARRRSAEAIAPPFPLEGFDPQTGESTYRHEPLDVESPERLFERRWALTLLGRVWERLRVEQESRGRGELFEALKGCVQPGGVVDSYRDIASRLHVSESAVKVTAHRLKARYRQLLEDEVADTVGSPKDVADELRSLIEALR